MTDDLATVTVASPGYLLGTILSTSLILTSALRWSLAWSCSFSKSPQSPLPGQHTPMEAPTCAVRPWGGQRHTSLAELLLAPESGCVASRRLWVFTRHMLLSLPPLVGLACVQAWGVLPGLSRERHQFFHGHSVLRVLSLFSH